MWGMFKDMSSLESLNLSSFNTSVVYNMKQMFSGVSSLEALDLTSFNTGLVENMDSMFEGMSSLNTLDLSHFNTSSVTDMSSMFNGMSNLSYLNLGDWETNSVSIASDFFLDSGSPLFSSSSVNVHLLCLNDDNPALGGNEVIVDGQTFSCNGSGDSLEFGNIADGQEYGELSFESYSKLDVSCDGDIVDFPDHSFVMDFVIDSDLKLQLPTVINSDTNFYIDWGDETCDHLTSASVESDLIHTYLNAGSKRVMIIGNVNSWGGSTEKPFYESQSTE